MQLHFYFWHELGAEQQASRVCLKYTLRGYNMGGQLPLIKAELIAESLAKEYGHDRY